MNEGLPLHRPTAPSAPIVLASASAARAALLRGAGVAAIAEPAGIDEAEIRSSLRAAGANAAAAAQTLAELKAQKVSGRHRGGLVLGADQILDCGGRWFDKPDSPARARADLLALRGRSHELHSCVVAVRDGARLWHRGERATLAMRPFSDVFLDSYLSGAGPAVLDSVGAYQLEGLGAQLFSRIEGDYFAILGLPLLPLLEFLRAQGALEA